MRNNSKSSIGNIAVDNNRSIVPRKASAVSFRKSTRNFREAYSQAILSQQGVSEVIESSPNVLASYEGPHQVSANEIHRKMEKAGLKTFRYYNEDADSFCLTRNELGQYMDSYACDTMRYGGSLPLDPKSQLNNVGVVSSSQWRTTPFVVPKKLASFYRLSFMMYQTGDSLEETILHDRTKKTY
jgi:hypothetical protein